MDFQQTDLTRACAAKKRGSMTAAIATRASYTGPPGKLTGGRDVDHLTAHIDILPTLIDLCELTPPDVKFDGISLTPLLNTSSNDWPARTLFVHQQQIDHPKKYKDFAAMTDRWRLVHTGVWRTPRYELFDHKRDPEQSVT